VMLQFQADRCNSFSHRHPLSHTGKTSLWIRKPIIEGSRQNAT
jgi:hypothetical protein